MYEDEGRSSVDKKFLITIFLALFTASGLLLNFISMIVYKTWWPLLNLLFWFFLPMPMLMCGHGFGSDCRDFSYFLTAILAVSGLALPLQLAQFEVIPLVASGMSIGGSTLVYMTMMFFCKNQLGAGHQPWMDDPF